MKLNPNEEYLKLNRIGWDEAAPIHRKVTFDKLKKSFQNPKFIYLNQIALQAFQRIGINGKSIAHLMCNNGREILSLKRMGAGECVGFDFSQNFINQGVELANLTNLTVEFICSDVLKIPNSYNEKFDIVFISSGSIRWVINLPLFFQVIRRLLKHGGKLLITEMHPILNTVDDNKRTNGFSMLQFSYFRNGPIKDTRGLNYWEDKKYEAKPVYYFPYTLGEIISQCLYHQMNILHFNEHSLDLSGGRFSKQGSMKLPLSFSLIAKKMNKGK